MNFQVPQFIEVEDKIVGPLSFRQFLYIAGGVGTGYIVYNLLSFLPFFLNAIPAFLIIVFGFALAFYKVNGRPFANALESGFWYYSHSRLYLWKKDLKKTPPAPNVTTKPIADNLKAMSDSKLKDLSWSLDVNEKVK